MIESTAIQSILQQPVKYGLFRPLNRASAAASIPSVLRATNACADVSAVVPIAPLGSC